ncbi:uncharacterized protein FIBRA_05349 [Fibroporia radiculosa]|uniref:Bromodomain associated domain-containing protein n=1 Tax=Fibroporia radiculosa TaxID=599839 RepID=J4H3G3_9APHY|nr:uncharacterized protein FIBRA_05349 [Fibroporia radiculosa]CCM03224.1 predicted protein [Fibroporia radiculosa]
MDGGAKKLLESVTHETLHAHSFSRSSTQATLVLTDLLSRYLALLTTTCAKYAEHAGRLSLSLRDAVSALDELGVGVDELSEYCAVEGRDLARYNTRSARRVEDLNEFKASLQYGLKEDRDDAISLVYARVPSPFSSEYDSDEEASELEEEGLLGEGLQGTLDGMDVDVSASEESAWLRSRQDNLNAPPPVSPPLPLSPISNPSTPPRKRQRTAKWRPPSYIPDHFPPFPTDSPRHSPTPPQDIPLPSNVVKLERPTTPPPPIAASTSSADYLTPIPYSQSLLASQPSQHLPSPPSDTHELAGQLQPPLPLPLVQPALLGAYHHVLTHPPPPNVTSVNPSRYKVALAYLSEAEVRPRWDPAPTVFSSVVPSAPRVTAMGPTYPVPISKLPPTPDGKEADLDKDRKSNLPSVPPKPVVSSERVTPLLSQQVSRLPGLARQVLPGSVYNRTTRLAHPPILQRGSQKLTYGPGVSAPWNTNASTPPAPAVTTKGKDGGLTNGKEVDVPAKSLPDARLYATWDFEQKRCHEPLVVRRGRAGLRISDTRHYGTQQGRQKAVAVTRRGFHFHLHLHPLFSFCSSGRALACSGFRSSSIIAAVVLAMRSFLSFTFLLVTLLASRALALNISVGGSVGTVPASQFLTVNDANLTNACQTQCSPANKAIQACGTSNTCLCDSATVTLITACEQCMFDELIAQNLPMVDPRAGSATALTAYQTACLDAVNVTVPTSEITLTLPTDWDGPFEQRLGVPATVFTVFMALVLACGSVYVINTM